MKEKKHKDKRQETDAPQQDIREDHQEINGDLNINKQIEELTQQLSAKDEEIKEAKAAVLRLHAEFENFKKRMEKERMGASRYAVEQTLLEVLPVLDSFDRAAASYEKKHSAEDIYNGFQLIQKQFYDTLTRLGVCKIECKGEQFDPNTHDALLHQESAEVPENTILDVCCNGYKYKDKIIRHAQVVIAKKPEVQEDKEEPEDIK
ncbi:MAG: nucleotide exchange factor GrpE [Candidatus Margulisiibacteriota bacterium]